MQWLRQREHLGVQHPLEIDHAQRGAQQVTDEHADHHCGSRDDALAVLHQQNHGGQHEGGNAQVGRIAIHGARATPARRPVHRHRHQRQADHGHHHAGDGMREQLADLRHEATAAYHHQRTGQRGAEYAGDAMLQSHADGGADKGEAGAHHARQADADRADALALHQRDDARAQQRGINQGDDLLGRQLERRAHHQWHGDDAAQRGQHVLRRQQHGHQQGWPILDLIQQVIHKRVSICFLLGVTLLLLLPARHAHGCA